VLEGGVSDWFALFCFLVLAKMPGIGCSSGGLGCCAGLQRRLVWEEASRVNYERRMEEKMRRTLSNCLTFQGERVFALLPQNHRITEWSGLEVTSVGHLVRPPAQAGSPRAGCTGHGAW